MSKIILKNNAVIVKIGLNRIHLNRTINGKWVCANIVGISNSISSTKDGLSIQGIGYSLDIDNKGNLTLESGILNKNRTTMNLNHISKEC